MANEPYKTNYMTGLQRSLRSNPGQADVYYTKGSAESTAELFYQKTAYDAVSRDTEYLNLTDFNFGEKLLYGRVNRYYIPIEAAFGRYGLKPLVRKGRTGANYKAPNYVVQAFNDLAQTFRDAAFQKKIDTKDPYLTNLEVHKAYQDPRREWRTYHNSYSTALKAVFDSQKIQVTDFSHFMKELNLFIHQTAPTKPFTYTAFVKSRICPVSISGLSIEIANLNSNSDYDKITQFYNSNNWQFFLNACRSHGFMVDRNIPWRIVADIGSAPMMAYAAQYGFTSTNQILFSHYTPASDYFFANLKRILWTLYGRVKPRIIIETSQKGMRVAPKLRHPMTYNAPEDIQISDQELLKFYFNIRFLEEESTFTDNEKSIMIDDLIEVYHTSPTLALSYFERILNKTFDYRGSLSYIIKAKKARENL